MAKQKEHDSVSVSINGKTVTKVVPTQVKDGQLVADLSTIESGVKQ